jgi:dimethylaniline monooxygenase (N-oxide forming)
VFPARSEGYFVGPHLGHHIDALLGDIGLPTRRMSNIVAEYLGPFTPARYADVAEQRRLAR